jgi:hypothetical protein
MSKQVNIVGERVSAGPRIPHKSKKETLGGPARKFDQFLQKYYPEIGEGCCSSHALGLLPGNCFMRAEIRKRNPIRGGGC